MNQPLLKGRNVSAQHANARPGMIGKNYLYLLRFAVLAVLAVLPAAAHAAPMLIVNHSFEDPVIASGTFDTDAAPSGWSAYGGNIDFGLRTIGVLNPNSTTLYTDPVPDGQNVGVVFLLDAFSNQTFFANTEAGLQQTLAATLQTLTQYTLTVEVGNIANDVNSPHNQFQFGGFPSYRIDLFVGGSVIASDDNTLLPNEGRFLTSTVAISVGAFHGLAGQNLGIRLVNLNSAPGIEVNFDNVRLDATPIPEPSSLSLFAMLAAGLAIGKARRRRGKQMAE